MSRDKITAENLLPTIRGIRLMSAVIFLVFNILLFAYSIWNGDIRSYGILVAVIGMITMLLVVIWLLSNFKALKDGSGNNPKKEIGKDSNISKTQTD